MPTRAQDLRQEAQLSSAARYEGLLKAYYPFWDAQYRPYLIEAVEALTPELFDFKPRPEMLTARQVVLHIAEAELWWIHHIVEGEPSEDYTLRHEDPAQGWVTVYDAPDHNALRFTLEEAHRHTQRWFGLPATELARQVTHRRDDGQERRFTLHWIFDHLQEHEIHHRAQLNLYLRLAGVEPPGI